MSVAIEHLKSQLEVQRQKLESLKTDYHDTIEAGVRAQRTVDAQAMHVSALEEAIAVLENHEGERGVRA